MDEFLPIIFSGRSIFDSFNRANSFTTMGSTETGQPWVPSVGVWGITGSGNFGYVQNGAGENLAYVEAGLSNVFVQTRVGTSNNYSRLVCRITDASNYIMVQTAPTGYFAYRRVSGTFTEIGSFLQVPAANDIMTLLASGNSIQFKLNNSVVISVAESFNQTATKHGLGVGFASGTAPNRFDYFRIEEL